MSRCRYGGDDDGEDHLRALKEEFEATLEECEQQTSSVALMAAGPPSPEQRRTTSESASNNAMLQRLRAAERIQLLWRQYQREGRRVAARNRRRRDDAEMFQDISVNQIPEATTVVSESERNLRSQAGLPSEAQQEEVVQAARRIQQLWKQSLASHYYRRRQHAAAARSIQRLWRQYREALNDYDEKVSTGTQEDMCAAAELIQQRWRQYRVALSSEESAQRQTTPPPEGTAEVSATGMASSTSPREQTAAERAESLLDRAAARIQASWRCYRAAVVAADVVTENFSSEADQARAVRTIQEAWREYQHAVQEERRNLRSSVATSGENDEHMLAHGEEGHDDVEDTEDDDGQSLDEVMSEIMRLTPQSLSESTVPAPARRTPAEFLERIPAAAIDQRGAPVGGAEEQGDDGIERGLLEYEEEDEEVDALSSDESDEAMTLIMAAASVTGTDETAVQEPESTEATRGSDSLAGRDNEQRTADRPPTGSAQGGRAPRASTERAALLVQRIWRYRMVEASSQDPDVGPGEERYPESLVHAVRAFQQRFRLQRLRQMVHDHDRAQAATRVQEVWRRHSVVRRHRERLTRGREEAAATSIQRFYARYRSGSLSPAASPHAPASGAQHEAVGTTTTSSRDDQHQHSHTLGAVPSCIICLDQCVQTALLPCGHAQYCSSCASRLCRCPTCRQIVALRVRIYL